MFQLNNNYRKFYPLLFEERKQYIKCFIFINLNIFSFYSVFIIFNNNKIIYLPCILYEFSILNNHFIILIINKIML